MGIDLTKSQIPPDVPLLPAGQVLDIRCRCACRDAVLAPAGKRLCHGCSEFSCVGLRLCQLGSARHRPPARWKSGIVHGAKVAGVRLAGGVATERFEPALVGPQEGGLVRRGVEVAHVGADLMPGQSWGRVGFG
eukprot:15118718-Alexandrium_andersonii.AAC.1